MRLRWVNNQTNKSATVLYSRKKARTDSFPAEYIRLHFSCPKMIYAIADRQVFRLPTNRNS